MSNRSVRKVRHRSDAPTVFTFGQRAQMGQITGKLNRKEITIEEIAASEKYSWMIEAWNKIKEEAITQMETSNIEEMVQLPAEVPSPAQEPV